MILSGFSATSFCPVPHAENKKAGGLVGAFLLLIYKSCAFIDALPEVMKAAFALLIWGGKVVIISTHDGAENP